MTTDNNNYLLFAGDTFYPGGGVYDFRARGSIEFLKNTFIESKLEWGHVVEADTLNMVLELYLEWSLNSEVPAVKIVHVSQTGTVGGIDRTPVSDEVIFVEGQPPKLTTMDGIERTKFKDLWFIKGKKNEN